MPVAVGGDPGHRGVIMTASYEARRFGVRSAMPSRTAVNLCPQLILLPARFSAYTEASAVIMAIFRSSAVTVETLSLDEAFLDVTGLVSGFEQARRHAASIKQEVRLATSLTVSLGVAASRLVAKIASDYNKPDGLEVVPAAHAREFLAPLPVRKLWGVGPKTEAIFNRAGIRTAGQLAGAEEQWILKRLGPWALRWRLLAQGVDFPPAAPRRENRQTSREITFERDTSDRARLCETLNHMAGGLARTLEATGPPRCVHLKLRYGDFRTITRQRAGGALLEADDIARRGVELLDQWWDGKPVRLIGLGLSRFIIHSPDQLSLFGAQ